MRRREVIAGLGAAASAWPLAARSQDRRLWRIGFLAGATRPAELEKSYYWGFVRGMNDLGYAEGRNFLVEWRFAEGKFERFPDLVADLIQARIDILVLGTPSAVMDAKRASSSLPIVMGSSADPVGSGFVHSLSRPGANVTGLASAVDEIVVKQLELLTTLLPGMSRVGMLFNPRNPISSSILVGAKAAAQRAKLTLVDSSAGNQTEIENCFDAFSREKVGALVVLPDAFLFSRRKLVSEQAVARRLPSIFAQREYVVEGGLMSYGDSLEDFYRRAATFVDKIIKGARPQDLPIELPTRFYLVLNLATAKAIGLSIAESFLLRADEVIE
jgi:putative ABC transport system substrate-binding protein